MDLTNPFTFKAVKQGTKMSLLPYQFYSRWLGGGVGKRGIWVETKRAWSQTSKREGSIKQ